MNLELLLADPFLKERVNPLFLQEIGKYATQAKDLDQWQKIQESLILFVFRKLLQPLYLQYKPLNGGTIFFLSTISSDGIGDYIALHRCSQLFKENSPEFDVKIGYTFQRSLPLLTHQLETYAFNDPDYLIEKIVEGDELPDYKTELKEAVEKLEKNAKDYEIIQSKSPLAAEAIEEYHRDLQAKALQLQRGVSLKEQGEKFYKELVDCRAIVNVSLALNTFENPLLAEKSLYFSETGNFQGIGHAAQLNWYSMGLLPFEEGIFLNMREAAVTGKYVSYITTIGNAKISYIYLVCQCEKSKDVEIVLFPLTEKELSILDVHYLRKLGIDKIKIGDRVIHSGLRSGKNLHLKQDLPVTYETFIDLVQKSPNPIGCTGDLSLGEVLSLGKIPFYEMRSHKIETIESLIAIAQQLHLDAVKTYFEILKEIEVTHPIESSEKIFAILPSLDQQWQHLIDFIKRYYCFEDSMLATMKAFFSYQDMPHWKQKEADIISSSNSVEGIYSKITEQLKTAS